MHFVSQASDTIIGGKITANIIKKRKTLILQIVKHQNFEKIGNG